MSGVTGYTQKLIEQGQSFNEFAWTCAREFGALFDMRDKPFDAPINLETAPSPYHAEKVQEAKNRLAELDAMTREERLAFGLKKKKEQVARYTEFLNRFVEENTRIKAMIREVEAFAPPTPDHQGLKDFMLSQLRMVLRDTTYYRNLINKTESMLPIEFWKEAHTSALSDYDYHTRENHTEIERKKARTDWLKSLAAVVGPPLNTTPTPTAPKEGE